MAEKSSVLCMCVTLEGFFFPLWFLPAIRARWEGSALLLRNGMHGRVTQSLPSRLLPRRVPRGWGGDRDSVVGGFFSSSSLRFHEP